ncbi:MATE family efflux transporter [Daejeonella oryzae]|uniref:MATE family efflux transporter n=1 Tax=Daejeonella oryzae TaxID=1122943 RepID=UPI0004158133|nr:MATE family efflux transporter [Daejeonella oryzae]
MKEFYAKYSLHYRSNLKLAIPVVISQLGHTLVHTADSVIVGHFAGTISLAAVSVVNSIFTIVLVIGIGLSFGLTPLIAQVSAKKQYDECGKLLSNSLAINAIAGVILYILVYFGSLAVIDNLNQSAEVVREAKPYLNLLGFSIIPLMIFMTFKQFAEGLGFTRQAMVISIWGNVLNIFLGITFVKGLFGIEPMGVSGVGWSTLIDRTIMAFVMGIYILKSKYFKHYLQNFGLKSIDRIRSFKILKIGTPVAMQYTFEISAFSGAALLIGTMGAVQLASHQVAISLASMTYMMASGISAAATIKTGNNFGIKDFTQLRLSAISSYHIVLVFMSITALIFVALNQYLPFIYTSDTAVISIAAQLLIIAGFFQLFDGAQVVGLGVLRGMGDVNIPTIITFIAYWVIGLPVGYLLGIKLDIGVYGIWFGLTLGLFVSAALLFIRFQFFSKKLQLSTHHKV